MWRYRAQISIESIMRELFEKSGNSQDRNDNRYPVLKLFFKEVNYINI